MQKMETIGVSLESFPMGAKQKDHSLQPIEVKERKRNREERQIKGQIGAVW